MSNTEYHITEAGTLSALPSAGARNAGRNHPDGLISNLGTDRKDPQQMQPVNNDLLTTELATMIAPADKEKVFAIVQRLIAGAQAVQVPVTQVADEWLTVEEAAQVAHVCRMTIVRWRNEQGLKSTKIGNVVRIRRKDLDAFLVRHMQG